MYMCIIITNILSKMLLPNNADVLEEIVKTQVGLIVRNSNNLGHTVILFPSQMRAFLAEKCPPMFGTNFTSIRGDSTFFL